MTKKTKTEAETQAEAPVPEPRVAPPQPFTRPVLRVQKQDYRDWIAAGGTPPIYGTFTVSGGIVTGGG